MADQRSPPLSGAAPSRRDVMYQSSAALLLLGLPAAATPRMQLDVDLFTRIAGLDVPSHITTIATAGWGRRDVGAAHYVFDPQVDREWTERYPRSSALSANGRGFRLDATGGDVRQYGAMGDGKTNDAPAINEALSQGGTVLLPGPATYRVTDRLLMPIAGTKLIFHQKVTLSTSAWSYRGSQMPFGNAIHVTGENCEISGAGPSSVIQNSKSDANGIGFLHCGGGRIARLSLKGGRSTLAAIADDTFQSGISIVNDRGNNARGTRSATIVEDCTITDWVQYGINVYGDLAADIVVRRNNIRGCGKPGDRLSVGAGIALTRGVGPVLLDDNAIADNKGCGIFVSSAGLPVHDVAITHNQVSRNGLEGICCSEERHFGAVGDIGQRQIMIGENHIEANGSAGIRIGTYDGVGSIRQIVVQDNQIVGNHGPGVLLQANAETGRDVIATIAGNQLNANDYGIAVGPNRIQVDHRNNRFADNRRGESIDHRRGQPGALVAR